MRSAFFIILLISFSFYLNAQSVIGEKAEKLVAKIEKALANNDFKSALTYSNELIALEPDNSDGYCIRSMVYIRSGQFDQAQADLDLLVKSSPNCNVYYHRVCLFSAMGQPDKTITEANTALKICEDYPQYMLVLYYNRGLAKELKRDNAGAYNDYMLALAFDSTHFQTLSELGVVAGKLDKDSIALVYFMKAYQIDSTNSGLINNIGFFYLNNNQYDKAMQYLQKVLLIDKTNPYAWNNLGYCKYKAGKNKEALEDINQSLKLNPANSYAYRNRALVYLAQKNKPAACTDLEKAMELGYSLQYGYDVQELYNKNCK